MRNSRELAENVAATEWRLSAEERAEIDRIFAAESCPTYEDYPMTLLAWSSWRGGETKDYEV